MDVWNNHVLQTIAVILLTLVIVQLRSNHRRRLERRRERAMAAVRNAELNDECPSILRSPRRGS